MRIDLSGKTALVTGSTSGMGYAMAKGLAEAGAAVVVHGRTDKSVSKARERLKNEVPGANLRGHVAELGDADAIRELLAAVRDVDILINNAGPIESKPFFELTDDDWERFFQVYVMAAVRFSRHYARAMVDRAWG